jgi:two-component system nitrogen regulation sensor histidine kinase GlnL
VAQPRGRLSDGIQRASAPTADDLIAASPIAMLVVDPADLVVQANASAEMLLNLSAQNIIGRKLADLLSMPDGYRGGEVAFAAYDAEIALRRGATLRADVFVTPFSEHGGWKAISMHAGAAAHRVGSRAQGGGARAAVRIAAMLAHEIKNPLAGIRGAAQLLGRSVDQAAQRMTQLIQDEVDRVAGLIDRMEGFTDTRLLERRAENIHAIIDHARAVAVSGYGDRLTIREIYDPSLPEVLVHRDTMVQIILNLLKNAAETADPGERRNVTITTAFRHGVSVAVDNGTRKLSLPIEVCIIDDGPGAPPEIVDQLFDPFVSSKPKGQGLGLALVDKLTRDMGGIVQYAREGVPENTVFRLLLPRADGAR